MELLPDLPFRDRRNRYEERFAALKAQGGRAFVPFTLLGWPDRERSLAMVQAMIDNGASCLELGIAFSDPVADGPVIQEAAMEVLSAGFGVDDAMVLLGEIRLLDEDIPIGLLVYYNLILARGIERFFREMAELGVDGVLIPDLPPEAAGEVFPIAQALGVQLIFIISPLTSESRLTLINQYAGGFLYIVSRLGITGVEERYDEQLQELLSRIRAESHLPACVGFGISTPEQARKMIDLGADGVIVGSRILQLVKQTEDWQTRLNTYLGDMAKTCHSLLLAESKASTLP